jgi:bifunctional non-homologous end joining protein LigD
MPLFQPCIPTAGKAVPARPDWFHEVKYDGYRLIVAREGNRVRLFTRNGHDWTDRFPWIVETAQKNRHQQFVVDGISDFNGLHSRQHNDEVQLYAFDILALNGEDLRGLPLSMRKTNLARLLARRPDGIFVAPFEQGEIGPDLFRAACGMDLRVWCRSGLIAPIAPDGGRTGSKSRTGNIRRCIACRTLSRDSGPLPGLAGAQRQSHRQTIAIDHSMNFARLVMQAPC